MASHQRKFPAVIAALGLVLAPVSASANTRASDSGPLMLPATTAQVGTFPYSSWLIPEKDEAAALWQWVLGGTIGFALISAFISNDPDRPNNGSNGAN